MASTFQMPDWPRYLTREQAALYLGVSTDTFSAEVHAGQWPCGRTRGEKGGKLTWDRKLLDREADRFAGLDQPVEVGHAQPEGEASDPAVQALIQRIDGQTAQHGRQRRQQAAA